MTAHPPLTDAPLASASVEQLFERAGAVRDGHFVLKSGRHAGRYLEKFLVLQHPSVGSELCRRLAEVLAPYEPTMVVGPTTGGVLLAFETARQLEPMLGRHLRAAFAEPVATPAGGTARALRRGWEVRPEEHVVLVDDILTTGASLLETADAVRGAGVEPVAAAIIADRSTAPLDLGFRLHALGRLEIPSWPATECAMCHDVIPLTKPGSS